MNIYTYEHLLTLLVQIEAILNSRPLYPLNDDPIDMRVITPGDLIGCGTLVIPPPITVPAQTHFLIKKIREEQRKMLESFWAQWQNEYLMSLLPRKKWLKETNFQLNQLVLIKDENLPPSYWLMGRIIGLHKNKDGLVRSVKIKTAKNTLTRAVQKLCVLPIEPMIEEQVH